MLIGILSDIHSNVKGLSKALKLLKDLGADKIVCLGDVVGYGNDPAGCLELVSTYCDVVIKGNHDDAVSTECSLVFYSAYAKKHILKQRKILGKTAKQWLKSLPLTVVDDSLTFVHASIPNPEQWLYPAKANDLDTPIVYVKPKVIFNAMTTPFLFVGHSHEPGIIFQKEDGLIRYSGIIPDGWIEMKTSKKTIIDVGSVGLPRNNQQSTCVLFDVNKRMFKFLKFDL